jgi:hypothetical protein
MAGSLFIASATLLAACALTQPPQEEGTSGIERYSLANGVRVLSVHAPDAERQCTFTFLPLSLATDPAGKAQWSHLLEHMMIRSTDSNGLAAGGVEFNGETGPDCMRLDTYATPESFRESIEKHAKWLAARNVSETTLEREKWLIGMEEATVARNLFTHKFAIAAWNQIVHHGRDHAAVHDDVANARAGDVQTMLETVIPINESVMIATIGPVAADNIRAALEELVGTLPPREADLAEVQAEVPAIRSGEIAGTWDLPVRHVILWWPAADTSPASRAVQMAAASRLMMSPPAAGAGTTLATALFHLSGGPMIVVNASLSEGQDAEDTSDRIAAAMRETADWPQHVLSMTAMFAGQLAAPLDFAAMRAQAPEQLRWLAEGQWLLTIAQFEYTWGMPIEDIAAELQALDAAAIAPALDALRQPPAGVLTLSPRE